MQPPRPLTIAGAPACFIESTQNCRSSSRERRTVPLLPLGQESVVHRAPQSRSVQFLVWQCEMGPGAPSAGPKPFPPTPAPNVPTAQFMAFFCWPLTMISRTWVRSIILVSISMMSGCSLAPLMNSSSVSSPADK